MKYRGRVFTKDEMDWIQGAIAENSGESRRFFSRITCEKLNWRKPDGGLKDMACRCAFLKMEKDGILNLPPLKKAYFQTKKGPLRTSAGEPCSEIALHVKDLKYLRIEVAVSKEEKSLWSELVDRYHYLGYTRLGGAQLRYLIRADNHVLGCVGWSSAAWKTSTRDKFIGWDPGQRERNLHYIVNNSRYLILPWVKVKCLASKVLAMSARQLPKDWMRVYGYSPVMLETFVEKQKFLGTCYKAANWLPMGETVGRGRNDRYNNLTVPVKTVWIYPLHSNFRKKLCI